MKPFIEIIITKKMKIMKKIGDGYWNYNGCDVYLAEHPKLSGKYEIYKGCDFLQRAHSLKEAKQIIINKFGKMSGKTVKSEL